MTNQPPDRSYAEAAGRGLGLTLAGLVAGMIEGGLSRDEALGLTDTYAHGLAMGSQIPDVVDDDEDPS